MSRRPGPRPPASVARRLAAAVVIGLAPVGALGALPLASVAGAAGECGTVLASGLANPRFVAVADDGQVYVSEAGTGGTEIIPRPAALPPGAPSAPNRGLTGRVTRIGPGGQKTVVAGNLPSYGGGDGSMSTEGATGPAGLVAAGGALWVVTGGPGPITPFVTSLPNEGTILRVDPRTGAVSAVADLTGIERRSNPDGGNVDSNPYGLAVAPNGTIYAADAGGNSLLRVNPATRETTVAAVFAGLPSAAPNPARGGRSEIDPVPTGVAVGADGSVYVGLLSGAPFPPGAAKVVRVMPDGSQRDFAVGLNTITGVAVGPDRMVYASEIFGPPAPGAPAGQPGPGRVLRIMPDGRAQVVADGVPLPNGIAFDRAGNLYLVAGAATSQGQLLRCDRIAAPGTGLPRTGTGPVPASAAGWARFSGVAAGLLAVTASLALLARRRLVLVKKRIER